MFSVLVLNLSCFHYCKKKDGRGEQGRLASVGSSSGRRRQGAAAYLRGCRGDKLVHIDHLRRLQLSQRPPPMVEKETSRGLMSLFFQFHCTEAVSHYHQGHELTHGNATTPMRASLGWGLGYRNCYDCGSQGSHLLGFHRSVYRTVAEVVMPSVVALCHFTFERKYVWLRFQNKNKRSSNNKIT